MKERQDRTVYEFSAPLLDGTGSGRAVSLKQYEGQVLLIVNTASACGFTTQYAGLELLYRTYKERGFAVLGFPCNQFGAQESGTAAEIGAFCEKNFGVTFPLFAKVDVNGRDAHPLYCFLMREKPGLLGLVGAAGIKWNFTKFLVDQRGHVVGRYGASKPPMSLAGRIERLLSAK